MSQLAKGYIETFHPIECLVDCLYWWPLVPKCEANSKRQILAHLLLMLLMLLLLLLVLLLLLFSRPFARRTTQHCLELFEGLEEAVVVFDVVVLLLVLVAAAVVIVVAVVVIVVLSLFVIAVVVVASAEQVQH
ncbi:unnamed protein product [Polarella glacialis]|uniref:Uncharacterized protein n=1 Tax=Polarella glacialis TaxID=89957 RepID=A0A813J4U4_POLGL|nr:unnamed protein product [Polarella glacialis]